MQKQDLALGRVNESLRTFSPHPTAVISSSPTIDCPFCPIVRKTPWYLHDIINDIIVCQDLNNGDYKLRILVVGSGTCWHEPWLSLQQVHRDLFVALADAYAAYAITKGYANKLHHLEHNYHSLFPGHAHIHACLI